MSEQTLGVPDGWTVVETAKPIPPPTSDARPSVTARAGVPAAGRGSQINPDQSMRGLELATTPLAHPTGMDPIDNLTSPVGLASLAAGGAGIVRAAMAEGAGAAASTAVSSLIAPQAKYWLTKTALERIGLPSSLAEGAAVVVSGIRKGGKAAATETAATEATAASKAEQASQARFAELKAAQPAQATRTAAAPASAPTPSWSQFQGQAPPVEPVPPPVDTPPPAPARPANNLPDQKALNEQALADARARFAAKRAAAPPAAAAPAPMKPLTVDEVKLGETFVQQGMTPPAAMQQVLALRAGLAESSAFGSLPSAAEARAALRAKKYKS